MIGWLEIGLILLILLAVIYRIVKNRQPTSMVRSRPFQDETPWAKEATTKPLPEEKLYYKEKSTKISEEQVIDAVYEEPDQVVGVHQPVGFWSKMIQSKNMEFIRARLLVAQKFPKKGYWQQMVIAQKASRRKGEKRGL
jgi:hypothetical protein